MATSMAAAPRPLRMASPRGGSCRAGAGALVGVRSASAACASPAALGVQPRRAPMRPPTPLGGAGAGLLRGGSGSVRALGGWSPHAVPLKRAVRASASGNSDVAGGDDAQGKKILQRRILRWLSTLPLAIGEMAALATLCTVGTVIEQNKAYDYYIQNYPLDKPVLGFLTYERLLDWGLDHVYVTWYFLLLNALLGASLMACSYTRQLPMVKVARNWKFMTRRKAFAKLGFARELESARGADLAVLLRKSGYQVFKKGPALYGFKGLAGRLAPIGVHVSMVLVMFGALGSVLLASRGTAITPEGTAFFVGGAMKPEGPLGGTVAAADARVFVNKFEIEYLPSGKVKQFTSDLSVIDPQGQEVLRKTISVNDPLRYKGTTMYQTDWAIAAMTIKAPGSQMQPEDGSPFALPMASLEGKLDGSSGRLWGSFLPTGEPGERKGISFIARDPRQVTVYDEAGKFVGVRRPGSGKAITVAGVDIVVEDMVGSTGLELKNDPGVPWVYAGFAGLMVTACVSYFSHSQVWALEEEGGALVVGGKTNRAVVDFEEELGGLLEAVPEWKGE